MTVFLHSNSPADSDKQLLCFCIQAQQRVSADRTQWNRPSCEFMIAPLDWPWLAGGANTHAPQHSYHHNHKNTCSSLVHTQLESLLGGVVAYSDFERCCELKEAERVWLNYRKTHATLSYIMTCWLKLCHPRVLLCFLVVVFVWKGFSVSDPVQWWQQQQQHRAICVTVFLLSPLISEHIAAQHSSWLHPISHWPWKSYF